jgi:hypothetical protein
MVSSAIEVIAVCERFSPRDWDRFAVESGTSFRGSFNGSFWRFDRHLISRVARFSCYLSTANERIKIAQAAISLGRRDRVFIEGLALLPQYEHLWSAAMKAILSACGPGLYHYGSPWSIEPPRDFARVPGASVTRVRDVEVYAIHFSRWESWEDYQRSLSTNVRRNMKRAERQGVRLMAASGLRSLRLLHRLVVLCRTRLAQKNIETNYYRTILRLYACTLAVGSNFHITIAFLHDRPSAAMSCISFGNHTYLMGSGSNDGGGVSWWMMVRVIREAYERTPRGLFVTGYQRLDAPRDPGLELFRHQCKATPVRTSEVIFRYQ